MYILKDSSSGLKEADKNKWPVIEVAAMNEREHHFNIQQQFGREYKENDMLIFQAQMIQVNTTVRLSKCLRVHECAFITGFRIIFMRQLLIPSFLTFSGIHDRFLCRN